MLLAAEGPVAGGEETCEVIFAEGLAPGTRIHLDGDDPAVLPECAKIKVDKFFCRTDENRKRNGQGRRNFYWCGRRKTCNKNSSQRRGRLSQADVGFIF